MPRIAYALAAAALLLPTAGLAQQQRFCAPAAQIIERLGNQFGEHLSAAGLDAQGRMLAVYSNPASGTWTVTVTTPDKVSCVVASGEGWSYERPEPVKPRGRVS